MTTRDEFFAAYVSRSGLTREEMLDMGYIALPCHCEAPECEGWQMRMVSGVTSWEVKEYFDSFREELDTAMARYSSLHQGRTSCNE